MRRVDPLTDHDQVSPGDRLAGTIWERAAAYHTWPEELLALLRLLDTVEASIDTDEENAELDSALIRALITVARTSTIDDLDPPSMALWDEFQDALRHAREAREAIRALAMERVPNLAPDDQV